MNYEQMYQEVGISAFFMPADKPKQKINYKGA